MLNALDSEISDYFRESEDESEINMAPLIDMIFILLIFFLVTTSFVQISSVKVERPTAETAQLNDKPGLIITVDKDGDILIKNNPVPLKNISAVVDRFRTQHPDRGVLIMADQSSNTGMLIRVLDQCRMAGAKDVAVAANQEKR